MKFAREDSHGLFSCSIKFTTNEEISNLTEEVEGEVAITSTHKKSFQYPLSISIHNEADFLLFDTTEKQVGSETEFPVKFPFVTSAGKDTKHIEIDTNISGVEGFKTEKPIQSSEFLNSYAKILTEGNSDNLVETIENGFDDQFQQENIRDKPLRNKADDYTTFQQYMKILSFIYKYGDKSNVNESRSLKKRLLSPKGEYQIDSYDELKDALNTYSSYDSLATVKINDIFSEAILDAWDFDEWDDDISKIPESKQIDEILERFNTNPIINDIEDKNTIHIIIILYLSGEFETIEQILNEVNGSIQFEYSPEFASRNRKVAINSRIYKNQDVDYDELAHFLYWRASVYDGDNEHDKDKKCASLYYYAGELFSESNNRNSESWGTESKIRSQINRGHRYKVKNSPEAYKRYSEAVRIFSKNHDIIKVPPIRDISFAARQAAKALLRKMRDDGQVESAAKKVSELEDLLTVIDELDDVDKINEFYIYMLVILAEREMQRSNLKQAEEKISTAINKFDKIDDYRKDRIKDISKQSLKLQKLAVQGSIQESDGNFNSAVEDYLEAKEESVNTHDERYYQIWSDLAETKQKLVEGQIENAIQDMSDIEEDIGEGRLPDLGKMRLLIDLLEDYRQGKRSDSQEVFERDQEISNNCLPEKNLIRYNTDYSVGFTTLLTRQRYKQLDMDRGKDEEFFRSLEDAVTPTGIDTDGKNRGDGGTAVAVTQSRTESQSENTVQQSADNGGNQQASTSGINKTRNRSQNRSYDAFEEDSDETIAYESHVEQTQEGTQVHEEAIDIVEDYLVSHGFRGGETDRSDLLVTNDENIILVEAKYITSENESYQTRKAVGQLLEYRYRDVLQDEKLATMDLTLWLLLTRSPTSSFEPILKSYQDMGIYTLWIDDGEIEGFKASIDKLNQIID